VEAVNDIPHDGLLRRIDMLNQEVIVITSPRLAAEFLNQRDPDFGRLPGIRRAITEILGKGLAMAEGEDHRVCLPCDRLYERHMVNSL
jgi:hypothetical protein